MSAVAEARARLRRLMGRDVERKSSDAFALLHAGDGVPGDVSRRATVAALRGWPSWDAVAAAGHAAQTLDGGWAFEDEQWRQRAIAFARAAFLDATASVAAQLRAVTDTGVDLCWLNGTARVRGHAPALRDVWHDAAVEFIDVASPVKGEITETIGRLGVPQFREAAGVGGRNVVVAVIDSQIDLVPAFARPLPSPGYRVETRCRYITEEPRPGLHGTAVAGIIGGATAVLAGMAPDVTMYSYVVLSHDDHPSRNADDASCALALQQAVLDGARLANLSVGVPGLTTGQSPLTKACNRAWALGLTIVKSAGNERGLGTITIPGDADGAIVVGSTDRVGACVPMDSSAGPVLTGRRGPDLVAPGGAPDDFIVSCVPGDPRVPGFPPGFATCGKGTSYAAAHVTGALALLLARQPDLTPNALRNKLLSDHCVPMPGYSEAVVGKGRLQMSPI